MDSLGRFDPSNVRQVGRNKRKHRDLLRKVDALKGRQPNLSATARGAGIADKREYRKVALRAK